MDGCLCGCYQAKKELDKKQAQGGGGWFGGWFGRGKSASTTAEEKSVSKCDHMLNLKNLNFVRSNCD